MYRLTQSSCIIRLADGAAIPTTVGNADYAAYLAWVALGNTAAPRDPQDVADEAAAAVKAAKDSADAAAARLDAKLIALAAMTPAQARAWISANVTNLAEAKDALGTLAAAVVVLARRL